MSKDLAMFDGEFIREMFANFILEAYPEEATTDECLTECMESEKYQDEFLELVRKELWKLWWEDIEWKKEI